MSAGSERQRTLTMKNCFNALLFMLVIGITLTISGCSSDAPERSQSDEPQRFESVIVDIQTGGDGYYSLMSDVEVQVGERGIESVFVEEPVLLAFSVSSEHQGGVWILDLNEGEEVIESLKKIQERLSEEGSDDLAAELASAIEKIEMSGPFTQAST
ncbi:MAG TPA: hypothetical protein IAA80_01295 [Candidatus Gallacutalibacter pullistercoris]|nr:hypothetical protein [Candidatus Gallacutalibacter pullistercoris]